METSTNAFAGMPRPPNNSAYRSERVASEEKSMCPVCLTTAVLIAGSATSTGGLAAIAIKKFGMKKTVDDNPVPTPSKLSRESNGAGEIVPNADQRRDQVDSFAEPQSF
jgi:hypothetical protein